MQTRTDAVGTAILFTLGGIPVFAALAVGCVWAIVWRPHEWLGPLVFFIGAAAGLAVAFRAYRRVQRSGNEPRAWLARLVPVLTVVGALGGAYVMHAIQQSAEANTQQVLAWYCEDALSDPNDLDQEIDASHPDWTRCMAIATTCHETARTIPFDARRAAEEQCIADGIAGEAAAAAERTED